MAIKVIGTTVIDMDWMTMKGFESMKINPITSKQSMVYVKNYRYNLSSNPTE